MRSRIYIAGPMRGRPEHNFPAFNAAAERFRALGWEVENPVEIGARLFDNDPHVAGGDYLRADVQAITTCEAIALLPEWEHSTGARCEVALAITIGLRFYDAETTALLQAPERVTIRGGYEAAPGPIDTFESLRQDVVGWQRRTFPHRSGHSIATHLLREARELHVCPEDVSELADVQLLLIGLADFLNVDLVAVSRAKLAKNERRTWGAPDADGVVQHVQEGVA